jgi:hypothetical protein
LIDLITTGKELSVIQQHYAKIIGHDFKIDSPVLPSKKKKAGGLVICLFLGIFFLLFGLKSYWNITSVPLYIRENLRLPSSFLERPALLKEIKSKLSPNRGIQTAILMGVGGAGKTTLAYHYANQYTQGLVWLIHANTKENITIF